MAEEENKPGEQKAAEAEVEEFREDLGPFVVAAETTRMPMVFTDAKVPDQPIIFANDSFLDLTGYTREEVLGQSFNFLMARGTDAVALAQIEAAFKGRSSDGDPVIRYRRKDDSVFWASVFISPVRDDSGDVVQHFASFVDLTKHRQEQERLQFLLGELNHRTQNTLATVLAIAGRTLRGMTDEETIDKFMGRILALSKTHGLLGAEDWDRVGIHEVLEKILQPFKNDERAARLSVAGDEVRLKPKAALTLGMVFHELATNAVAHGAFSNEAAGRIDISWKVDTVPQGEQMRLRWQESGGPPVTPPHRKGFGSRLIESGLAQELNGEVSLNYESAGVVCEVIMPVAQGVGRVWMIHE
jgi:PAS domain S-box-containing protein